MLRSLLSVYFLALALQWIVIYGLTRTTCVASKAVQSPSLEECEKRSDVFDQQCVLFEGHIAGQGHWWFDLFFIKSYTLVTPGGARYLVFTKGTVPSEGQPVMVAATFRQFWSCSYFIWIGVVERKRFTVSPRMVPEPDPAEPSEEQPTERRPQPRI